MISYRESLLSAFGDNKGLGFRGETFLQNDQVIGYASERECVLYLNRDIILEHPLWRNVNLKSGRIFVPEGVRECTYVDSRGRAGSEGAGGVQAEGVKMNTDKLDPTNVKTDAVALRKCVVVHRTDQFNGKIDIFYGEEVWFKVGDQGDLMIAGYRANGFAGTATFARGCWISVRGEYRP